MDTMVVVTCDYCGIRFERPLYHVNQARKMGWKTYCSRQHTKLDNPSVNAETQMTLVERAWAKIIKGDGCWEWQGSRNRDGYGQMFTRTGEQHWYQPQRVIWEDLNGPIPVRMEVCHSCDNPPCCRPDHLFLGTHQDNMADRATKMRMARAIG